MEDHLMDDVDRLHVGIDFGTTFTGIAFVEAALVKDPTQATLRHITTITEWAGSPYAISKVPSVIAYDPEDPDSVHAWGSGVSAGMEEAYSWLKMHLNDDVASTKYDIVMDTGAAKSIRVGTNELPEGKSAVDVIADFLKKVHEHLLSELARLLTQAYLDGTPITFVLTVPATFSDKAKNDIIAAMKMAGFNNRASDLLRLVTEPEAAMIATLVHFSKGRVKKSIPRNSAVILGDLGGGTIDFVTYYIADNTTNTELRELVPGQGAKSGSIFVNQAFYEWACNKFDFETAKMLFGSTMRLDKGQSAIPFDVRFAGPPEYDRKTRSMMITDETMKSFFQKPVENILGLLQDQLDAAGQAISEREWEVVPKVETVVLAGGFGTSPYVRQCVQDWCDSNDLQMLHTDEPRSATLQGAVLWSLDPFKVTSRKARRHYGFSRDEPFDENFDDPERKIEKGQEVPEDEPITRDSSMTGWASAPDTFQDRIELYCSDADIAPRYKQEANFVGYMEVDFSRIPRKDLDKKQVKMTRGRKIKSTTNYLVEYKIELVMDSKAGVLKYKVIAGGKGEPKTVATKDINYSLS
ncbi:hypothetical protein FKW77_006828 [Venturia effusa]|uniref:Uncharacterized protein n=1 Tax=Venturia effusa TaxID=50376 RepID=A0A517LFR2_9PEZI|nr:hypothetical protein FKW77_006828 [Venturia effusa]